jgi:hypothetical protein
MRVEGFGSSPVASFIVAVVVAEWRGIGKVGGPIAAKSTSTTDATNGGSVAERHAEIISCIGPIK